MPAQQPDKRGFPNEIRPNRQRSRLLPFGQAVRQAPVRHHRPRHAVPAAIPVCHEEDRHPPGSGPRTGTLSERQDRTGISDVSHMVAAGAYGPDAERDPTPARRVRSLVQRTPSPQRLARSDTPRGTGGASTAGAHSAQGTGPTSAADRGSPKALSRRPAIAGPRYLGAAGGLICATVRLSDSCSCHAPGSAHQLTEAVTGRVKTGQWC